MLGRKDLRADFKRWFIIGTWLAGTLTVSVVTVTKVTSACRFVGTTSGNSQKQWDMLEKQKRYFPKWLRMWVPEVIRLCQREQFVYSYTQREITVSFILLWNLSIRMRGLSQDDYDPIHWAQRVTEWLKKCCRISAEVHKNYYCGLWKLNTSLY